MVECSIMLSCNTLFGFLSSVARREEPVDPAERAKANWLRLFNRVRLQLQEVSEIVVQPHTGTDSLDCPVSVFIWKWVWFDEADVGQAGKCPEREELSLCVASF